MEIWKAIEGYPYYEVSNEGRVRSLDKEMIRSDGTRLRTKGRVLALTTNKWGYKTIFIRHNQKPKGFSVHRLVAKAFIENKDPKRDCVNHIDGVKHNNSVENLEWCTRAENNKHARDTGLWKQT